LVSDWSSDVCSSDLFAPPPPGIPSPLLWGDDRTARERLAAGISGIRTARQKITFDFPFAPAEVVQFFRKYFGPIHVAFSRLDPQKQTECAAELEKVWREHNEAASENRTLAHSEYLEVIATRA